MQLADFWKEFKQVKFGIIGLITRTSPANKPVLLNALIKQFLLKIINSFCHRQYLSYLAKDLLISRYNGVPMFTPQSPPLLLSEMAKPPLLTVRKCKSHTTPASELGHLHRN